MRFGILLYSSKIIKIIEANGGELPVSSTDEVLNEKMDDISTLVILINFLDFYCFTKFLFSTLFFFLFVLMTFSLYFSWNSMLHFIIIFDFLD